jgi:hypothetical protein
MKYLLVGDKSIADTLVESLNNALNLPDGAGTLTYAIPESTLKGKCLIPIAVFRGIDLAGMCAGLILYSRQELIDMGEVPSPVSLLNELRSTAV